MIKTFTQFAAIVLIITIKLFPQSQKVWFPDDLNIQPFTANVIEAKAGFEFLLAKSEIRLNAGTSRDFYKVSDENSTLSFGVDFFTYSLLRSESDFHFPVDAIDYLFGLNAGYKTKDEDKEYGFRLRVSHISAHFVDGHFDYSINSWRNGRSPQVYSREFIEIFPFIKFGSLRFYSGFTYLFNVTPDNLGKEIYQAGFDYYMHNAGFGIFSPFIAYDFKLSKIEKFFGNNSFMLGIKFGHYESKGFSIRFSYLSGKSIHGEYYNIREKYSSIGFNLEL
ncbi:MAG: hypothetical protein A2006_08085 [Ignavibacteria bacterium GWC2_35_8]|nr:MAG: hypothetical protein A2006_08085 [Ignavibacteria bacterium GWC2_35_8]